MAPGRCRGNREKAQSRSEFAKRRRAMSATFEEGGVSV
jgi:hypothetical protein